MAEFDFNAIQVSEDDMPVRQGGPGKTPKYADNPFLPWVQESWDTGKGDMSKGGRSTVMPKAQVKDAVYLIRRAAGQLELGVSVALTLPNSVDKLTDEQLKSFGDNKHIKVRFCAKQKRAYHGRTEESTPAETVEQVGGDVPPTE